MELSTNVPTVTMVRLFHEDRQHGTFCELIVHGCRVCIVTPVPSLSLQGTEVPQWDCLAFPTEPHKADICVLPIADEPWPTGHE